MIDRAWKTVAAAGLLGVFIGAAMALSPFGDGRQGDAAWSVPVSPGDDDPADAALSAALFASGHFDGPDDQRSDAERAAAAAAAAEAARRGKPPIILGVTELDGVITVNLRLQSGARLAAQIGEPLEGGWSVAAATFDQVTFSRGEDSVVVALFNHSRPDS